MYVLIFNGGLAVVGGAVVEVVLVEEVVVEEVLEGAVVGKIPHAKLAVALPLSETVHL
jgi:hypothetical protein